jgi:DNA-binding HxlR family transcriptional regulator
MAQVRAASKRVESGETTGTAPAGAAAPGCPVAAFQKLISGKYKLRIVWDLRNGPRRYGEIRTGLLRGARGSSEIAPRALSRELKALVAGGLLERKDYGVVPPRVDYRLTSKGESFVPVIDAIRTWGEKNLAGASDDARR